MTFKALGLPGRRQLLGAASAWALGPWWTHGQAASVGGSFPTRPLTLVVPFAPGGIADLVARAVAEEMGHRLGQTMIVDNRPGAGSLVATQAVVNARPDGHTLLLLSNGHAVSVGLFKKLPYDLQKDLAPITTLGHFDLGFFVAQGSRHASLADVVAQARARPGGLTIGTITPGSTQHLAAKWFESVAGIEALVVPFKGTPAVLSALRAGDIDLAVEILGPWISQVQSGTLRALAVSSDQRNPALPQVPTVQQAGVPGYQVSSWNALAAPAATPPEVLTTLHRAARQALGAPAVISALQRLGVRAQGSTPDETQALLKRETQRWGAVIRAAQIVPE